MKETSQGFRKQYSFLSNFAKFDKPMKYDGMYFTTVEHFYVAMKTLDKELRLEVSNHPAKGLKAFGMNLPLRSDWGKIKLEVMKFALEYKFSAKHNPRLRMMLNNTKGTRLVEYNTWGDKFFGVCLKSGVGENMLGKLITKEREK